MCHPGAADKVALLNKGLAKVRSDGSMQELCERYPAVKCDLERTYDEAKGGVGSNPKQSQVTIAMEAAYAPFNDFHPLNGLVGFDTELVPLVCDAAGIECSVVTVPWKKAWPGHPKALMGTGFLNHEFDCTTASGATFPRRSTLKFSNPYTKAVKAVFVGKHGTELRKDGKGTHVGTVVGFSCGKTCVQREMPRAKITEYPKSSKLFAALERGAIDVAVTLSLANAQKHTGEGYGVIKTLTGFNDGMAFMCHPGAAPKIAALNAGLAAIRENGKLEELCSKYSEVECDLSGREFNEAEGGVTAGGLIEVKSAASGKALSLLFVAIAMTFM
jgi:ABC-type amino acid transport substrate-binding protein